MSKAPKLLSKKEIKYILENYETGYSLNELAEALYCDPHIVKDALINAGVNLREKYMRRRTLPPLEFDFKNDFEYSK